MTTCLSGIGWVLFISQHGLDKKIAGLVQVRGRDSGGRQQGGRKDVSDRINQFCCLAMIAKQVLHVPHNQDWEARASDPKGTEMQIAPGEASKNSLKVRKRLHGQRKQDGCIDILFIELPPYPPPPPPTHNFLHILSLSLTPTPKDNATKCEKIYDVVLISRTFCRHNYLYCKALYCQDILVKIYLARYGTELFL